MFCCFFLWRKTEKTQRLFPNLIRKIVECSGHLFISYFDRIPHIEPEGLWCRRAPSTVPPCDVISTISSPTIGYLILMRFSNSSWPRPLPKILDSESVESFKISSASCGSVRGRRFEGLEVLYDHGQVRCKAFAPVLFPVLPRTWQHRRLRCELRVFHRTHVLPSVLFFAILVDNRNDL